MPDGRLKRRLEYILGRIAWPMLALPPVETALGRGTTIRLTPHIGEFDFLALFESRLRYEREVFALLDQIIDQFDAVLEIGANVGIFTLYFARHLGARGRQSAVIAFEPAREAFTRLHCNLALNDVTGAQIFNCAVGEQTGFATFFEPQGHLTNGSLDQSFAAQFSAQVRATRVQMVSGNDIGLLLPETGNILIKVDVEGAEARVLRSLQGLIERRRPTLLIEVLQPQEEALNSLAFLHENYTLYNIRDCGLVAQERFVGGQFRDYLLQPKRA